jgi:hypothetical protein
MARVARSFGFSCPSKNSLLDVMKNASPPEKNGKPFLLSASEGARKHGSVMTFVLPAQRPAISVDARIACDGAGFQVVLLVGNSSGLLVRPCSPDSDRARPPRASRGIK